MEKKASHLRQVRLQTSAASAVTWLLWTSDWTHAPNKGTVKRSLKMPLRQYPVAKLLPFLS